MYKIANPVFFICETPLHAGSGNDLGVIDLPIQRERHTSFPKIEGSSLKGAIRQAFEDFSLLDRSEARYKLSDKAILGGDKTLIAVLDSEWKRKEKDNSGIEKEYELKDKKGNGLSKYQEAITLTFGPEDAGGEGHAGALGFTDARLLFFPIKSMKGVFAWVTCPKVLQQFFRDMSLTALKDCEEIENTLTIKPLTTPLKCSEEVGGSCGLFLRDGSDKIVLEEYTFTISENKDNLELKNLLEFLSEKVFPVLVTGQSDPYDFWRQKLMTDVVVLADEDFTDFVNLSTEVITRNKINNDTGTVADTGLFTEEYLPAESIMYSLVLASPIFKEKLEEKGIFGMHGDNKCFADCPKEEEKVMKFFEIALPEVIQIGGNATLGKGLVRARIISGNSVVKEGVGENDGE